MKHSKRIIVGTAILFAIFFLYVIIGSYAPFFHLDTLDDKVMAEINIEAFYGAEDKEGVDRASIIEDNQDALEWRLHLFSQAKERIVLSTYDIRWDESCSDVFAALYDAAERGVKVQILVDGLNGWFHMGERGEYYFAGSHPNIEIKFYNNPSLIKPWTLNGRLHDKYTLVDQKFLIVGGRNIFNYFLGNYITEGGSSDRDVLIYNTSYEDNKGISVIESLYAYFEQMWANPLCTAVYENKLLSQAQKKEYKALLTERLSNWKEKYPELFTAREYKKETLPTNKVSYIANPTHIYCKEPVIFAAIMKLAQQSKTGVKVFTPYTNFNEDMYQSILNLTKSGVNIDVILNSVAVGDNFMASSDYIFNRENLLKTGITIYEYQGERSNHGKSVAIDDDISIIGSYNFDMRSTYLNTELMLVIQSKEVNRSLNEKINVFLNHSLKVRENGTYEKNPKVEEIPLPWGKRIVFSITSIVFQLFRNLI